MPTNMCGIGAAVTVQAFGAPESLILCMCMAFHTNQWGVVSSSLALGHAQHSRLWGHKSLSKPALSVQLPGSPFEGLASTCITFLKKLRQWKYKAFSKTGALSMACPHTQWIFNHISYHMQKSTQRNNRRLMVFECWVQSQGLKHTKQALYPWAAALAQSTDLRELKCKPCRVI